MFSSHFKEILSVFGLIGIPSIFAMTTWCIKQCTRYTKQLKILMKAQQAQMRKDLLNDYNYYTVGGWISDDNMEDWENRYQAYHELGANGVMDAKRNELLKLPNRPPVSSN